MGDKNDGYNSDDRSRIGGISDCTEYCCLHSYGVGQAADEKGQTQSAGAYAVHLGIRGRRAWNLGGDAEKASQDAACFIPLRCSCAAAVQYRHI